MALPATPQWLSSTQQASSSQWQRLRSEGQAILRNFKASTQAREAALTKQERIVKASIRSTLRATSGWGAPTGSAAPRPLGSQGRAWLKNVTSATKASLTAVSTDLSAEVHALTAQEEQTVGTERRAELATAGHRRHNQQQNATRGAVRKTDRPHLIQSQAPQQVLKHAAGRTPMRGSTSAAKVVHQEIVDSERSNKVFSMQRRKLIASAERSTKDEHNKFDKRFGAFKNAQRAGRKKNTTDTKTTTRKAVKKSITQSTGKKKQVSRTTAKSPIPITMQEIGWKNNAKEQEQKRRQRPVAQLHNPTKLVAVKSHKATKAVKSHKATNDVKPYTPTKDVKPYTPSKDVKPFALNKDVKPFTPPKAVFTPPKVVKPTAVAAHPKAVFTPPKVAAHPKAAALMARLEQLSRIIAEDQAVANMPNQAVDQQAAMQGKVTDLLRLKRHLILQLTNSGPKGGSQALDLEATYAGEGGAASTPVPGPPAVRHGKETQHGKPFFFGIRQRAPGKHGHGSKAQPSSTSRQSAGFHPDSVVPEY